MSTRTLLDHSMWLVKVKVDGEWCEACYGSKDQAAETAAALIGDYGLSPDEVNVIPIGAKMETHDNLAPRR
jgi:hypothetical protein